MYSCPSCQTQFTGTYCNNCSEKIIDDKDFSLISLFSEAIGFLTNLDSKFYQTLKLLLIQPGQLSLNNVNGIRVKYMKAFQIFIIANILFFIFLAGLDIFYIPSQWFFNDTFSGITIRDLVDAAELKTGFSTEKVTVLYDSSASTYAKALIFLLIPIMAMVFLLLNPLKKIGFGKHVIFGMHYFSFFLMFCVVWTQIGRLIFQTNNRWLYISVITLVSLLYLIIAFKKFYQDVWWLSILKAIIAFFLINSCIIVYRACISIGVLSTLG